MSNQILTFSLGAAVGVCAAGAFVWATRAKPIANGFEKAPAAVEEVAEAAPAAAAAPVAPEDRPADAPESCPGVSSGSVGKER